MKYLLFQLHGPLQSWGSSLPGEIRQTERHPTKSGICGLIAACLGITRKQNALLVDLNNKLGLACRVDAEGRLLEDYHTISIPKKNNSIYTIITKRYYLCDACFTACLWHKGCQSDLEEIASALIEPYFSPYLGRKSCIPSLPFNPIIIEAENLKTALEQYKPDNIIRSILSDKDVPVYWEGDDNSIDIIRKEKSYKLLSRRTWSFIGHIENVGFVPSIKETSCT